METSTEQTHFPIAEQVPVQNKRCVPRNLFSPRGGKSNPATRVFINCREEWDGSTGAITLST
jgi:hypothetical protein